MTQITDEQVLPYPERTCVACERGEKTTIPPHSSIVGSNPVHYPSGNVCMKYIPEHQYQAMLQSAAERIRKEQ